MANKVLVETKRSSFVRKDLLIASAFAFIGLILIGPLLSVGIDPDTAASTTGEGSIARQASYLLVMLALLFALKPIENYKRVLAIPIPMMVALAYCWLSLAWAIEPGIALRRLVLLTLIVWMVFAMIRQLKFEEVLFILRWLTAILLVANYIAAIFFPSFGTHIANQMDQFALVGDWRGILTHKNIAGVTTAFTVILFAYSPGRMPRKLQYAVLVAAMFFLYMTNSKTSFGLCIAALAAGTVFLRYKLRYKGGVIAVVALLGIVATVLGAVYQNPLVEKLNDPTAFTGRTKIWKMLYQYISDHPFLGSGYGSFWNIGASSPVFHYASDEVTQVPYGHNGFLDIAAQLGIPGLIMVIIVAVVIPFRKLLNSPFLTGSRGAMLVALFLFCICYNFTESALFYPDSVVWVMLMITMGLSQPDLINYQRAKFDVHELFRVRVSQINEPSRRRRRRT